MEILNCDFVSSNFSGTVPTTPVLTKHSVTIAFMYRKKIVSTLKAYNSVTNKYFTSKPFETSNFKTFFMIHNKKLTKNGHFK